MFANLSKIAVPKTTKPISRLVSWIKHRVDKHRSRGSKRSSQSAPSPPECSSSEPEVEIEICALSSSSNSGSLSGHSQTSSNGHTQTSSNDTDVTLCEPEQQHAPSGERETACEEAHPSSSVTAPDESLNTPLVPDAAHDEALSLRSNTSETASVTSEFYNEPEELFDDSMSVTSTVNSNGTYQIKSDPPYPRPTNTEEWFKTFTSRKARSYWLDVSLEHMALFHPTYSLFDFSTPQIIDMELAVEKQPLDVQIYFAVIGMMRPEYPSPRRIPDSLQFTSRKDCLPLYTVWRKASPIERRAWITEGFEVLQKALADGRALRILSPSETVTPPEPFSWADYRLTRFPANISWTDPYESAGWALNVDGQYRLEEEEQEAIEDLGWMDEGRPYLAVDRFSMTGVITLSNIRIPLPQLDPDCESYIFNAVCASYRTGHPARSLAAAREQLEEEWRLEEGRLEYDQALRVMLLLRVFKYYPNPEELFSIEPWRKRRSILEGVDSPA